jgi:hypothetical protein
MITGLYEYLSAHWGMALALLGVVAMVACLAVRRF